MINLQDNPELHHFSAPAMNTDFALRIACPDPQCAADAASTCFTQLEELEAVLSRYRPDSDVSRINALVAGESVYIAEVTHDCLLQAMEASQATAGLFDPSLGVRTGKEGSTPDQREQGPGQLEIARDRPLVTCLQPGRKIDLGGIGKGFALDQLAMTLHSFGMQSALISAGASTLLALGDESWPVNLSGDQEGLGIALKATALSASGIGIQGAHVVHPDHSDGPTYAFKRVWVVAATAALADAFSTACLIMDAEELKAFAQVQESLGIYVEPAEGGRVIERSAL